MTQSQVDRLLHPDEARKIVFSHVEALEPESVPLDQAGDRFLVDDFVADVSLPPFPAATMDGYAVIHDDSSNPREVLGSGFAGDATSVTVTPGTAAKIMTGAPVPDGADAVVQVENTKMVDGQVEIHQSDVRAGSNIRQIGADLREGDLLIEAGTRLGPAEVGLLASLGRATVLVGRRPRVVIYSTGNELVDPAEVPGAGQIRDSNRFSLEVAARRAGAEIVRVGHIADEEDDVREALTSALADADVVITSGGVSMGDKDLIKLILGEMSEVHFRRLFMKPGKPMTFATTVGDNGDKKLLFGLPGNPVSCLVCFHLFVRPALQVMQSTEPDSFPTVQVALEHDIETSDRIEYQRAVVSVGRNGMLQARTTGSQMSARLMSFIGSNAFLIVPPSNDYYPAGETLDAILVEPPGPADL